MSRQQQQHNAQTTSDTGTAAYNRMNGSYPARRSPNGRVGSEEGNSPDGYGDDEQSDHIMSHEYDDDVDEELEEDEEEEIDEEEEEGTVGDGPMRHGFEASEDMLRELESRYFLYYTETRHQNGGRAKPLPYSSPPDWRAKDKVKIVHGALVVCLRIGFDPPDVIKTSPCARLEAWVDTAAVGKDRAMEQTSANLCRQFESLAMSSKAKFTPYMDPAHEDLRKVCVGLRRKARNDRALFHYNGHGVPRPTSSGEIWVFNRQYTQYIPVSVGDIVGYLGAPAIYIWDCSNAGHITNKIQELQSLPEGKFPMPAGHQQSSSSNANNPNGAGDATPPVSIASIQDIIMLAACQPHETLPMNPDLPADLFTSCVTSPIEMSIRFFILHNPLRTNLKLDTALKIPGKLSDRKTPLGELIWIFTSVTDTIAWNTVPRHLFQRLFRHDLVLAAIFRGFLLAERIMRRYDCNPISVPALPSCANHPLWDSWDLALDRCLSQMPALMAYEEAKFKAAQNNEPPPTPVVYSHSYFFADHLSAFSVWIDQGTARTVDAAEAYMDKGVILKTGFKRTLPLAMTRPPVGPHQALTPRIVANGDTIYSGVNGHPTSANGTYGPSTMIRSGQSTKGVVTATLANLKRYHKTIRIQAEQPDHLPILLQVLLSQVHRLRALMLLCKFLDLGPWAVNLGLSIGIFPYVLKLLQAPGPELRPVLIYIWARILGIYRLCQEDLAKAAGLPSAKNGGKPELPFHYFAGVLDPNQQMLVIPNVSEHRAMCAFIISVFMRDYPFGQQLALTSLPPNSRTNVLEACLYNLNDEDPLLRQWSAICIAILWDDFDEAKGLGVRLKAHSELTTAMHAESIPEVRAAILFALGVFIGTTAGDPITGKSSAGRPLSGSAVERTGLSEQWQADEELGVAMATLKMQSDGSVMVRKELVILLSAVVYNHRGSFVVAAYEHAVELKQGTSRNSTELSEERMAIMEESLKTMGDPNRASASTYSPQFKAIMFSCMYRVLLDLSADPFPDVSERACIVIDYIHEQLLESDLPLASISDDLGANDSDDGASIETNDETATQSSQNTLRDANRSNHQPPSLNMEGPKLNLTSALRSLSRLGLSDPHTPRYPASSAVLQSGSSSRAGLHHSKSSAQLADPAGGSARPSLRHNASADSLLHTAQVNARNNSKQMESARTRSHHSEIPRINLKEAKDALCRSDQDRHQQLRKTPAPVVTTPARIAAAVPLPSNPAHPPSAPKEFRPNPTISNEDGKPTSREIPLRSEIFEWSAEYFISPQMKEKECDEPGSVEYTERHWRRERNEKIIARTQALREIGLTGSWDQLEAELDNTTTPEVTAFHQFEPHVLCSDHHGVLRLYNWQLRRSLNRFSISPQSDDRFVARSKVTFLRFVNDDDQAILVTGTSDGSVRVFRDYESPKPNLITAWRALTQLVPTTYEQAGMVCDWQQTRGRLIAGGNAKELKIWDVQSEICGREIVTRANSCVTSLTSDQVAGDIMVAGFGDGAVRVYDSRLPPRETMVRAWRGFHRSWVKNVRMQRGGNRELVTASLSGEVCAWDIRMADPIRIVQAHSGGLTALDVHEHAPVFATGSESGVVKVWNILESEPTTQFRNSGSARAVSPRDSIQPITTLEFHPHDMVLAVGATNAKLNIYQCVP